uniref:uncharacterized protein LOC122609283 n=1 Tax=Erigeron canadensis TaxID=72917 RepID=UPI001CB9D4A2|nr:uncharacterized protein LOC122609283 [Erigeron canadensis]
MSSPTNSSCFRRPFSVTSTMITAGCRQRFLLRALFSGVLFFLARQLYLISTTTTTVTTTTATTTGNFYTFEAEIDEKLVNYYSKTFQDLMENRYLTDESRTLTIGTQMIQYTTALKQMGFKNPKSTKKIVFLPFTNDTFDFQFSSHTGLDCSADPGQFSSELTRTLKNEGFLVIHTESNDSYSLNSLLDLFDSFRLIRVREIGVQHWTIPGIREIVLKKQKGVHRRRKNLAGICSIPAYKKELIRNLEPLIENEPLKPWIEFKKNLKNIKYLSTLVNISFKTRYVYIDVGSRNYGSSIGNWFKKHYPKQNKMFEVFAVEADKRFHQEYKSKKKITLLPYAAWVRNESLFFEINRAPNNGNGEKEIGMGRVQTAHTSTSFMGDLNKIQGFDFSDWVKSSFGEKDFVVMKMDVEGTEFDLVKKMVETGAICLVDEVFLECHYNRWQRCCEGERSRKYQKVYKDCLELFSSLREKGVLVHQWF